MEREAFVSKVSEISKWAKEVQRDIQGVISIELDLYGNFKLHLLPTTFKAMFKEYKEEFYFTREQSGEDCYKIYVNIDGVEYFALEFYKNKYEERAKSNA